jgi:large subunit ribosomal protein L15
MKMNNLRPAKGATHSEKRIGRGQGSGRGGTSTRGHKGDKARSGHKDKRNHEGGQMPLQMRLPKVGFRNPFKITYVPLNLGRLQAIADKSGVTELSFDALHDLGVISKFDKVKVLATGTITTKIVVSAHKISDKAKQMIEAAGGSVQII